MEFVDFRGMTGLVIDVLILAVLASFIFVLPVLFFSKAFSLLYDSVPAEPVKQPTSEWKPTV